MWILHSKCLWLFKEKNILTGKDMNPGLDRYPKYTSRPLNFVFCKLNISYTEKSWCWSIFIHTGFVLNSLHRKYSEFFEFKNMCDILWLSKPHWWALKSHWWLMSVEITHIVFQRKKVIFKSNQISHHCLIKPNYYSSTTKNSCIYATH
jgi:hypothetical protein